MSALVSAIRAPEQWLLDKAANPATYQQQNGPSATIKAFIRGIRSDDLFASAMQQDVAAVINADQYAAAFPVRPIPSRYDRLRTATMSYAVEEWRGAPNDDAPVFYKLLLRGGQQ
jgi:hypothetical protein